MPGEDNSLWGVASPSLVIALVHRTGAQTDRSGISDTFSITSILVLVIFLKQTVSSIYSKYKLS